METALKFLNDREIKMTDEIDYAQYLINNHPDHFFYIDQCPFSAGVKHGQFELVYREAQRTKFGKRKYDLDELKFINILSTLWLYSDVFVSSDIGERKNVKQEISKDQRTIYERLYRDIKWHEITEIDKLGDMELLIQLAVRNSAGVEFYFEAYDLFIVNSWSCFMIYFNDLKKLDTVEKIINTHGLFLRRLEPKV